MSKSIEGGLEVGLVFAGGTIFSTTDTQGFRTAESSTDLVNFVDREFPDLGVRISRPAEIGYNGLSENIDLDTLAKIRSQTLKVLKRPKVKSAVLTHGSDFPEVTGSFLDQDPQIKNLLSQKRGLICITYSNNPFPAEEARINLKTAIIEATRSDSKPGIYITSEHGAIPITGARKETYEGKPMRFFDYKDPEQKSEEDRRRFRVCVAANELAKNLGYQGIFELIAKTIPNPFQTGEHRGSWVATVPGPYKTSKLVGAPEGISSVDAWRAAILSHALDNEQITPFPESKAFFWPVNRPSDPFQVEMTIQGFFPDIKACILILNHSSTAHTKNPDLSIATAVQRLRVERNITTFAVTETGEPTKFGEGSYITSRDLRNAGVIPLPMHAKIAWVKMWAAIDRDLNGLDLIDFMITQVHPAEFTGELDLDSIRSAKNLIRNTPIRQLQRAGYGTGYLQVPYSKRDSIRTEPRRI